MTHQSFQAPLVPPQHLHQFLDIQNSEKNKPSSIMPWFCSFSASYSLLPCAVICLRNLHLLISAQLLGKVHYMCQGCSSPQHPAQRKKGGKAHFSVDVITFLTLQSYSFDWSGAINPAVLCLFFQENLLLLLHLQQYFRESMTSSGCNPNSWGLAAAHDPTQPL